MHPRSAPCYERTPRAGGGQFARLRRCYEDVRAWSGAAGRDDWPRYDWLVRTRPDQILYEPAPSVRRRRAPLS